MKSKELPNLKAGTCLHPEQTSAVKSHALEMSLISSKYLLIFFRFYSFRKQKKRMSGREFSSSALRDIHMPSSGAVAHCGKALLCVCVSGSKGVEVPEYI